MSRSVPLCILAAAAGAALSFGLFTNLAFALPEEPIDRDPIPAETEPGLQFPHDQGPELRDVDDDDIPQIQPRIRSIIPGPFGR